MIQSTASSVSGKRGRVQTVASPRAQQHYSALYQRLLSLHNGTANLPHAIGVTSCNRGEGVSTVASNLAVSAALIGNRPVLLVDAHWANPSVAQSFQTNGGPGLIDVMCGEASLAECIQPSSIERLSLITAGNDEYGSSAVCNSAKLTELLEELRRTYHLIVFDLPTANELSPCFPLAAALDGVLLVVEAERVRHELAQRAKQQLQQAHANVLGVVFNKQK